MYLILGSMKASSPLLGLSVAITATAAVSTVVVLIAFGFSLSSHTASAEKDFSKCIFGEKENTNCQKQQDKAFNRCIEKASSDGELTEDEYFTCAYSIYG
jgi:hypothetical protein